MGGIDNEQNRRNWNFASWDNWIHAYLVLAKF